MSNSALASLTAQYTDSENEDDNVDDDNIEFSGNSQGSQDVVLPKPTETNMENEIPVEPPKKRRRKKSVKRLVSYQDDAFVSESESSESEASSEPQEDEDDGEDDAKRDDTIANEKQQVEEADKHAIVMEKLNAKYAHYNFSLPAEPKGKVAPELLEKIRHLHEKMCMNNMDMNRIIQGRKEFRNPSIYEKLIQFCDINEFGTNYSPEVYDPLKWGPESYYEELARVQKNEMWKRQKERKEMDKVEQATALARKVEEEAKKRKSKWDQPAVKALPQALTTTVTGTKGTVISAFGSLPKKPPA